MIADCVMASNLRKSITLLDVTTNLEETLHVIIHLAIQFPTVLFWTKLFFNDDSITIMCSEYMPFDAHALNKLTRKFHPCSVSVLFLIESYTDKNGFVFD